mmetsp:Transcript_7020/g.15108  ORF Transcript_7020/g.15108 Transcript_7020/m.15108 type:complete len:215 (+) Transcript_7020:767-1411(+)
MGHPRSRHQNLPAPACHHLPALHQPILRLPTAFTTLRSILRSIAQGAEPGLAPRALPLLRESGPTDKPPPAQAAPPLATSSVTVQGVSAPVARQGGVDLPMAAGAALVPSTIPTKGIIDVERGRALAPLLAPGAVPLLGATAPRLAVADTDTGPRSTPPAAASGTPVRPPALQTVPATIPASPSPSLARPAQRSHGLGRKKRQASAGASGWRQR